MRIEDKADDITDVYDDDITPDLDDDIDDIGGDDDHDDKDGYLTRLDKGRGLHL